MSSVVEHGIGAVKGALPDELATVDWQPVLPTIASPSWVSGDSEFYEGRTSGGVPLLLRALRPATAIRVDCAAMFAAQDAAGQAGLAPAVIFADAGTGVCVQERLGEEWQVGTLYRLLDPALWRASLRARRAFRELAVDLPPVSVFDQIGRLVAYTQEHGVQVPTAADETLPAVKEARALLFGGSEARPCHGDGAVSDLLLNGDDVRLVGWTQTGRMDPLEEIGSVLTELAPHVAEADEVFAAAWGERDPSAQARAHLYGLADDVRWGLIGTCARAAEPDSPIEYQRYGSWRLFKARFAVATGEVDQWLKEAS